MIFCISPYVAPIWGGVGAEVYLDLFTFLDLRRVVDFFHLFSFLLIFRMKWWLLNSLHHISEIRIRQ
jgi:hypothetical protein